MKYLAHVNIGLWKPDANRADYESFVEMGAHVNNHAATQKHLKWQFGTQFYQDPNVMRVFAEPRMILNLSVWDNFDALKVFVYQHAHLDAIKSRDSWFEKLEKPSYALWWVDENKMPTLEDAKEKLGLIEKLGSTAEAFDFKVAFDENGQRLPA